MVSPWQPALLHPVSEPMWPKVNWPGSSRTWIVCGRFAAGGSVVTGPEEGVAAVPGVRVAAGEWLAGSAWLATDGWPALGTWLTLSSAPVLPATLADGLADGLTLLQAASASARVARQATMKCALVARI